MRKLNFISSLKLTFKSIIVWIWWHLPIKRAFRQKIKDLFFSIFGVVFYNTKPYKNWLQIKKISNIVKFNESASFPDSWKVSEIDLNSDRYIFKPKKIAQVVFIIHAFYPDIFQDIFIQITREFKDKTSICPKLYVSTTAEQYDFICEILADSIFEYHLFKYENRGRDILPFLTIAQKIDNDEVMVVKIHTKKSNHRLTGDLWRKELFDSLLTFRNIEKAIHYFNNYPEVGIIGTRGNVVPMSLYFGGNALALAFFCRKMQISVDELKSLTFVAGSMFFARLSVLSPLLDMHISSEMFEEEAGQNDGTMAHAIERVFSLSSRVCRMSIVDTSFPKNPTKVLVTADHPYTW